MYSLRKWALSWLCILASLAAYAQQDVNLPLGALPMQYNGSFAGEAGSPRISSNFGFSSGRSTRDGDYPGGFQQHISFDHFVPALATGFGAGVYGTQDIRDPYSTWGFYAAVAPKISLKGKWTLSPSVDLAYDDEQNEDGRWRSRAGLLVNTSKFYLGYSVAVFDQATVGAERRERFSWWLTKYSSCLQIGYTFQKNPESDFSFTPQLAFYTGIRWPDPDGEYSWSWGNFFRAFHLNFRYKRFLWGANNTGVHVGWQSYRLRLSASNGISFAGRYGLGYSGNLSLRYVFLNDEK
jgi:hypothetical protein